MMSFLGCLSGNIVLEYFCFSVGLFISLLIQKSFCGYFISFNKILNEFLGLSKNVLILSDG